MFVFSLNKYYIKKCKLNINIFHLILKRLLFNEKNPNNYYVFHNA